MTAVTIIIVCVIVGLSWIAVRTAIHAWKALKDL